MNMGAKNKSKYCNLFFIGQKIGKYTIENNEIHIDGEAKITCKCDCGTIKLVSCYSLIKGTSKQCSTCGNSKKRMENPAWKGYGDISGKMIGKLKRDAKIRELDFNVSIEFLDKLLKEQNFKCALTGLPISSGKDLTASVDRIDSMKGYVEDNIQWLHKDINMMKRHYTEDYFINMCKLVAKNALQFK